jgi:hypothetical protein
MRQADLRQAGSFFMPEYLLEVMEAVARENLKVEKVFAMHTGPTDWTVIKAAIEKARSRNAA